MSPSRLLCLKREGALGVVDLDLGGALAMSLSRTSSSCYLPSSTHAPMPTRSRFDEGPNLDLDEFRWVGGWVCVCGGGGVVVVVVETNKISRGVVGPSCVNGPFTKLTPETLRGDNSPKSVSLLN